jgi:murein DD-endopeptidase MepM/ murein hydrolase activator NlpD
VREPFVTVEVGGQAGQAEPSRRWTFSRAAFGALVGGGLLALALIGFLATRVAVLSAQSAEVERLLARNAQLEEEAQKVLLLEQELAGMRQTDLEIREMLGLALGPEVRLTPITATAATDSLTDEERAFLVPPRLEPAMLLASAARSTIAADPSPAAGGSTVSAGEAIRSGALPAASLPSALQLSWPVPGWVSSRFGDTRPGQGLHTGLDIAAPTGTPVTAAASGAVVVAGYHHQYGRLVVIEHPDGVRTFYGHNSELKVARGDVVERGQEIARVGSTGQSTAPHLHFEVRRGEYAIDPEAILPRHVEAPVVAGTN